VSPIPVPPSPQGEPGSAGSSPAGASGEEQALAGSDPGAELINQLAEESREFDGTGADPERNCWLVVHRHHHGVLPSEYDIREIPEDLYLAVLAARRANDQI
jgi:hypothetical protein